MKKFIQKSEDRKLIDQNLIKDRQLFFYDWCDKTDFIFSSDLKLATKDYAQMYILTY